MADWYMKDGDLPYLTDWKPMVDFTTAPDAVWRMKNGDLPYHLGFLKMPELEGGPEIIWRMKNGDLPYKLGFPKMPEFDDGPELWWRMKDGDLPYKLQFPPMPPDFKYPPKITKKWIVEDGKEPWRLWPILKEYIYIPEAELEDDVDWTASMRQTYEYYTVDPNTWMDIRRVDSIMSSSINRDSKSETYGSSSLETTELLDECYIRTYMVVKQNGKEFKVPLGTYLYTTAADTFDGAVHRYSMTGYTPLIELTEKPVPIGYWIKGLNGRVPGFSPVNVITRIGDIINENSRCRITMYENVSSMLANDYVAAPTENWLDIVKALLTAAYNAQYAITIDPMGTVKLINIDDIEKTTVKYVFDDGNSSILLANISAQTEYFGIPNVIELIYNGKKANFRSVARNDDPASIVSTVRRGREVIKRVIMSNTVSSETQEAIDARALELLENASTVEKTIAYSHGYCDVAVGDCVILNYKAANLTNIRAKVISQSISCVPGCTVDETAVYTEKLWRRG